MLQTTLRNAVRNIRQLLADSANRWQLLRAQYRELGCPQREVRGIRLLQAWLSPEQLVQFNKYGYFEVTLPKRQAIPDLLWHRDKYS